MKKITFLFFAMFCFAFTWQNSAQSVVIGTGTTTTTSTGSDPIDGYFNSFRYQVVYTAAELSTALTPYDEITALGWSIAGDYGGGALLGYTIKIGHTSAVNSATHDASTTTVVKNPFDYNPTVTAEGVFDMITFDTNFVWNGVDNIFVEVCSDGQNPFVEPYGQVRTTTVDNGSRRYRTDGDPSCAVNTTDVNGNKPNVQFNYIDGTVPTDELDYYNLQWPPNGTIDAGATFDVYAQAYEAGLTDVTAGQAPGILCWIGYSTTDTDPSGAGWTWVEASFNSEVGNNDEYTLNLGSVINSTGTFYYASRWNLNGAPYSYGGIQADGSYGGIWGTDNNISGVLTVNAPPNDDISGAIALTIDAGFCDGVQNNGANIGATDSGEGAGSCFLGENGDNDVWFSVTIPSNIATIDVSTDFTGGTLVDTEVAIYSGTSGNLVEIDCDQDGGTTVLSNGSSWNSLMTNVAVTGGETYLIQVAGYEPEDTGTFCIEVTTNTLGVDSPDLTSFTYFPNPVKNTLNLNAQSAIQNVSVYNMLGQEVLRAAPNSLESDVNMNQLQSGAYFVKVTINDNTETIRVIKQ